MPQCHADVYGTQQTKNKGCNARKVISEVYTSFVLQCTVYACLQIPPKENWFQYERRVYATEINFPCIITLGRSLYGFELCNVWRLVYLFIKFLVFIPMSPLTGSY